VIIIEEVGEKFEGSFYLKIFSDECTFKSDGSVNTWNSR